MCLGRCASKYFILVFQGCARRVAKARCHDSHVLLATSRCSRLPPKLHELGVVLHDAWGLAWRGEGGTEGASPTASRGNLVPLGSISLRMTSSYFIVVGIVGSLMGAVVAFSNPLTGVSFELPRWYF